MSECDNINDTEAYEILEDLLETKGDCSSEDGIDLSESDTASETDDSETDPDFTPTTPPRTRGRIFIQMYSRKNRRSASIRNSKSGSLNKFGSTNYERI